MKQVRSNGCIFKNMLHYGTRFSASFLHRFRPHVAK